MHDGDGCSSTSVLEENTDAQVAEEVFGQKVWTRVTGLSEGFRLEGRT